MLVQTKSKTPGADVAYGDELEHEPRHGESSPIRLLVLALVVGGAYYVGALIGFALTFPNDAVSTLWPPNAILLSALLLTPTRTWWVILLGALPAHFAVQLQTNVPMLMIFSWFVSNSAEAMIGAICLRYLIDGSLRFDSFQHVGLFTTFAVFLSPFVTSFLDAGFVVLNQWRQVDFWEVWKMRFHANVLAALTLVPAIVLWARNGVANLWRAPMFRCVEGCLLVSGLLAASVLVFSRESVGANTLPALVYLPLPFLLWAAVRFGTLGSSTCVLIVVLVSIWETVEGCGPFVSGSPAENVFFLHLFLIVVAVPLLFLTALLEERKRTEQTRAEAAAIVESFNDAIIGCNLDGTITTWNRGADRLYDYSAEETVGRSIAMLVPADQGEFVRQVIEKIGHGAGTQSFEGIRIAKGGRSVHVSVTVSPVLDASASGKITGVSSITRDITEHKLAETRLRAQFAITQILSESGSIADAAPRILRAICECLDWKLGEIWRVDGKTDLLTLFRAWHFPSRNLAEFTSESQRLTFPPGVGLPGRVWKSREAGWIRNLAQDSNFLRNSLAAKAGLRCAFGFPILLGNQTLGAMVFFSYDEREPDRDLLEMMASVGGQVGQFIERKRAEESLRESEEHLRLTLEAGHMGVWDWDKRTNAVNWSKDHFTIMGLAPFSMKPSYHTWASCVHPDDLAQAETAMETAIAERKDYQFEYRVLLPDGGTRWVEARGTPVYDELNECVRVRGLIVDVTERKGYEEALKEALAQVQQLKQRLEADNVYLREELSQTHRFGAIIGESEGIKKVFEQVEQVAATDMTVLVLGETGTGKELVARLVHEKSGRRERPLVKVNCSTLPAELIESELFGHERGAFTGAVSKQVGRFELADRGTIFLDEVGELPLRLQPKLLRVLQEGEFERLGSGKTIKVDVRVIAATNRDLIDVTRRGRFRADLYYRLNVYPIEITPLRDRRGDIGLMAQVFLVEAGRRLGKSFGRIPNEVIEALREYSWPGNVRELENVIGRAAIISTAPNLQLPDGWNKKDELVNGNSRPGLNGPSHSSSALASPEREATLGELQKSYILEVLHQTKWRIEGPKGAALVLGLHPNTLRSRLNKLGIRRPL